MKAGIPSPVDTEPPAQRGIISFHCWAEGRACSTGSCCYMKDGFSFSVWNDFTNPCKRPDDMDEEEVDEMYGEQQDARILIVLMSGTDMDEEVDEVHEECSDEWD